MVYNLDEDLENADWLRSLRWNQYLPDGTLIETLAQLRQRFPDEERLKAFLRLPAAVPMPDGLRKELRAEGYEVS